MKKSTMSLVALVLLASVTTFAGNGDIGSAQSKPRVCESDNKGTIVVLEQIESISDKATASMLIVKMNGQTKGERVPLKGTVEDSAKGQYMSLVDPSGRQYFVAAGASASPDELTIGNETIELNCNN